MPSVNASANDKALYDQVTKSNGGVSSDSRNKLAKDLNTFLTLLTSQLKHQDPTSPMDSSQFTQQLVQYAQVEQQISQNEKLDKILTANNNTLSAMGVNYIGKYVEAESSSVPLQDGVGRFAYGVASTAKTVGILIKDSTGKVVRGIDGSPAAGVHEYRWDGKDDSGNQLPDGSYSLSVTAIGDNGTIETYTTAFGRVTGVTNKDGEVNLIMDKLAAPMSKILSASDSVASNTQSLASSAIQYLGKTVEMRTNVLALQDKAATFRYTLPDRTDKTTIVIKNAAGNTVRTIDGSTTKGEASYTWDGKDDAGNQLADGSYSVAVSGKLGSQTVSPSSLTTFGKVTGVVSRNGIATLQMGKAESAVSTVVGAT